MADMFKISYNFLTGLRLCGLEDCTKFQLNLPYLDYNIVLRTLGICHYGPVCDVLETGLYSVCYAGASLRDSIPTDIRNESSVYSFRKNLKQHYINLY